MPPKSEYIAEIEADLKTKGGESDQVLKERLALVKKAKNDVEARDAYHGHVAKVQGLVQPESGSSEENR